MNCIICKKEFQTNETPLKCPFPCGCGSEGFCSNCLSVHVRHNDCGPGLLSAYKRDIRAFEELSQKGIEPFCNIAKEKSND